MLHVMDTVDRAVEHLVRARIPADPEDLKQEGQVIALATLQRYPDKAREPGYLYTAVVRHLGKYASRCLAAVSISGAVYHRAREFQYRVPVEDWHRITSRGPEDELLEGGDLKALTEWRTDVRRFLEERVLSALPETTVEIVKYLFGFDGLSPMRPAAVAEHLGVDVREVYRARVKLQKRLQHDLEFYGLSTRYDKLRR